MTKRKQRKRAVAANVIGPALRRHRQQAGLTQKELAARCHELGLKLPRGTLAKIEARVRFVKACELFIIAKILRICLEDFYPPDFGNNEVRDKNRRR